MLWKEDAQLRLSDDKKEDSWYEKAKESSSLDVYGFIHCISYSHQVVMEIKKGLFCLILIMLMICGVGCNAERFMDDPLCGACIDRACGGSVEDMGQLKTHFSAAEKSIQAQLLSRLEAYSGCSSFVEPQVISDLYARYGAAFFAVSQPYLSERAVHAVDAMRQNSAIAAHAVAYLTQHIDAFRADESAFSRLESELLPLAEENEAIFASLCRFLPPEKLSSLIALPPTLKRDAALLPHYASLDAEVRQRLLKPYILGEWHMQSSGSTALPQYLELDWGILPLPEDVAQPMAVVHVKSVSVSGEEAKKRGVYVRTAFEDVPMMLPDRHKKRVDLGAWLKTSDTYRVAAQAEIVLWPQDVAQDCIAGEETCTAQALATFPVKFDQSYRAYIGVDTGAPRRSKSNDDNEPTTRSMILKICNAQTCTGVWDKKLVPQKARVSLDVTQGHDFYLWADIGDAKLPVAGRLMARAMPGATWQEVATFFGYAPLHYAPAVRANIDVSSVCRNMGKCELELQLRPSLRMARRDPSIRQYWGETLDLGKISLNIMNRTPQQIYREIL